jgi:hypothetical protein
MRVLPRLDERSASEERRSDDPRRVVKSPHFLPRTTAIVDPQGREVECEPVAVLPQFAGKARLGLDSAHTIR